MGEQTPADVIDAIKPASTWGVSAEEILAALDAAGFEVRPVVDADTRAEAALAIGTLRSVAGAEEYKATFLTADARQMLRAAELLSRFVLGEEPR